MDDKIRALANEPFYATTDAIKSFFALGMTLDAKSFMAERNKVAISEYGSEYAIIKINGLMLREKSWLTEYGLAVSTEEIIEEIDKALGAEKKIKLMMNTGGGLVSGTSNLAKKVFENRDSIEAYATGSVASAGMWVFASAGKRYAEDTTLMGSIGVVTSVFDDEKYWESYGIVWKEIVSENAENKRPDVKKESGQAEVKRLLTSLEDIFIESVSKSLDMSKEDIINKFNKGGLITGKQALEIKAINGIIAANTEKRGVEMKEEMDKLQASLAASKQEQTVLVGKIEEKDAAIASLQEQNSELQAKVENLEKAEKGFSPEITGEIINMAFEHGVNSKETLIEMISKQTIEGAGYVAFKAKGTSNGTQDSDLGGDTEKAKAEAKIAEEQKVLDAIAKSLNVN